MKIDTEAFKRDGYVRVPGLYTPEECSGWKARTIQRMQADGSIDDPSGVSVWMHDQLDDYDRERMQDPRVVAALQQLIGPAVEFLSVKAVFKNASTVFGSPWHQDWHYWGGTPKISVWIALDEATPQNGCLKVIPGSHNQVCHMGGDGGDIGFVHRARDEDLPDLPVVTLDAAQGDAVIFHDLLLHSSHPNTAGADRWAFISTYRDASVCDESTVWASSLLLSGRSVNA